MHFMRKKIIIITLCVGIFILLIPFGIKKILYKKGNSFSVEIPYTSYCGDDPLQTCSALGGLLIFKELPDQGKIIFKRENTKNNCYELNIINKKIQPQNTCDINEELEAGYYNDLKIKEKYIKKCSPSNKYCINHSVKGKIEKGGGIGFISNSDDLYGIEIFEVEDKIENKILYREVKIKIGGSWDLSANTYWSNNDNFLIFDRDNRLYYLPLD